jgi:uncharacterized protein (DUF305 family)
MSATLPTALTRDPTERRRGDTIRWHTLCVPNDLDPNAEAAAFDADAVPLRDLDAPPAGAPPAAPDDEIEEDEDDDDVVLLSWYQRPVNILAIVVAVALIGGMVGWLIADARSDARGSDVDIGFLQDMRTHHEQAVEMAFIYDGLQGTNPGLRTVANSIIVGQQIDIGRMIQMLRDFHAPEANETDTSMAWMGMPTPSEKMPGMATDAQLHQLSQSSGRAADELFVQLMTAHHKGGISMAQTAAKDARTEKVRSMAQSMVTAQQSDIVEMQQQLS